MKSASARWTPWLTTVCFTLACASPSAPPATPPPAAKEPIEVSPASPAATEPTSSTPLPPDAPRLSLRDPPPPGADAWPAVETEAAGFDRRQLERIVEAATATQSSSLLILKNGQVVVERYFDQAPRPIETMSATKSVVSIAIGILITDGKIRSIDEPLSTWFPDFAKGKKAKITLRNVLTHSSGLAHGMGAGAMNKEKDRLAYARSREVVADPGSVFSYNNEATQLLSGVVAKSAGVSLDEYLGARLFKPLGITDWRWERDGAGNVQAFYGLSLHARDLAKIGLLFANQGRAGEARFLTEDWVRTSTSPAAPSDFHGYLWWVRFREGKVSVTGERIAALRTAGFDAADKLEPLVGIEFPATAERNAFWMEAGSRLDAASRERLAVLAREGVSPYEATKGETFGFAADGWLGQQLIVVPALHVVAVRQHEAPAGLVADDAYNKKVGYFELARDLERALVSPKNTAKRP